MPCMCDMVRDTSIKFPLACILLLISDVSSSYRMYPSHITPHKFPLGHLHDTLFSRSLLA